MTESEWQTFLGEFSRELLADPTIRGDLPPNVITDGYLGFPPGSENAIAAAEARLGGIRLPPSYRTFLRVSDGWHHTDCFIRRLRPAAGLAWFHEQNQDWIDAYVYPPDESPVTVPDDKYLVYGDAQDCAWFRSEYLQTALQISEIGEEEIVLLNPRTVTAEGEWETWFFANWLPGANRYRSFQEFMESEYRGAKRRREEPAPARSARAQARPRAGRDRPWWRFW